MIDSDSIDTIYGLYYASSCATKSEQNKFFELFIFELYYVASTLILTNNKIRYYTTKSYCTDNTLEACKVS